MSSSNCPITSMLLRLTPGLPPPPSLVSRSKELQRMIGIKCPKTKSTSDSGSSRLSVAVLLAAEEFNKDSANANMTINNNIDNISKAGCCKPRDVKEMLAKVRNTDLLTAKAQNKNRNSTGGGGNSQGHGGLGAPKLPTGPTRRDSSSSANNSNNNNDDSNNSNSASSSISSAVSASANIEACLMTIAAKLESGAAPQTMKTARRIFGAYEKSTLTGLSNIAKAGRSDVSKHKEVYAAACLYLAGGCDKKEIKAIMSVLDDQGKSIFASILKEVESKTGSELPASSAAPASNSTSTTTTTTTTTTDVELGDLKRQIRQKQKEQEANDDGDSSSSSSEDEEDLVARITNGKKRKASDVSEIVAKPPERFLGSADYVDWKYAALDEVEDEGGVALAVQRVIEERERTKAAAAAAAAAAIKG
jgi:hypothetical protein